MRTRKASIIERSVIYGLLVAALVADGFCYQKRSSAYNEERVELEKKRDEILAQITDIELKNGEKKRERRELQDRLKIKEKKDKEKLEEHRRTIELLKRSVALLPPLQTWPDLIKQIEILATKLGVTITNFTTIETRTLESKELANKFIEFNFLLEFDGEYGRVMEYLWNLEYATTVKHEDTNKIYRAVMKVTDGGFRVKSLQTTDNTMALSLTLMTFFKENQ